MLSERFDHDDFPGCPRHAGTPRQFECDRLIIARQVTSAINAIPVDRSVSDPTTTFREE